MNEQEFRVLLRGKGRELYRDMPWRRDTRPYYVLVSELMLQQTQVDRVIPKFNEFIRAFPDERALAAASLADVLRAWSGLGYNRRAKFLHDAAKKIVGDFNGRVPATKTELLTLPGVGEGTAGAIMVYAYNQPTVFIETNVRTVYFHHFFADNTAVADTQLLPIIQTTIDQDHPREFYWALMDYGSWLKQNGIGNISQSKHYKKQAPLKGSPREVRGQIIRYLTKAGASVVVLRRDLSADDRFDSALNGLIADGLVTETDTILHLTK